MNDRIKVWDLPVRVFHWALAASFVGAYVLSDSERLRNVHVMLGYTVLGLLAFRLLWGFLGSQHARFRSFACGPRAALRHLRDEFTGRARRYLGHNPAGAWAIYGLLVLGVATGLTGYLTYSEVGGEAIEEAHEFFANAWLLLVAVHVIGVAASSIIQRENLVRAMVTGYKSGAGETPPSRNARPLGLTLAAAVLGFWVWTLASVPRPVIGVQSAGEGAHAQVEANDENDDD